MIAVMCGITGSFGKNHKLSQLETEQQFNLIAHRGPDSRGVLEFEECTLLHTRLSIQDPECASQPMKSRSGRSIIIFNGEIYNFPHLIKEFSLANLFTSSDTEVVLELVDRFGPDVINAFEGMFAFAIFNKETKELILARDRFGEKPLFFTIASETLFFSSSPLAVKNLSRRNLSIGKDELLHYFKYQYFPEGKTPIEGITQVLPGNIMRFKMNLDFSVDEITPTTSVGDCSFRKVFQKSVNACIVSDVPIGLSLSGGIDSTITLCEMAKSLDKVQTFTLDGGDSNEDIQFSRRAAELFKSQHHEIRLKEEQLPELILKVLSDQPLPFGDSSIVLAYALAKYAKSYVKVLIGGDGADEVLSGYDYYRKYGDSDSESSRLHCEYLRLRLELGILNSLGRARDYGRIRRIQELEFTLKKKSALELWYQDIANAEDSDLKALGFPRASITKLSRRELAPFRGVNSVMAWDQLTYLTGDILWKSDTAGMMASLEVRTPFLNPDLVKWASKIQFSKELSKKTLIRGEYNGEIPESFFTRRKRGFGAPIAAWLRIPVVNDLVNDVVRNRNSRIYDYMDFIEKHKIENISPQVKWNVLALALWLEKNA